MITSKPKKATLFSVTIFLLLAYGLLFYTIFRFFSDAEKALYQYVLIIILAPIALGVTFKILFDYKVLQVAKEKIWVKYPFRFKKQNFNLIKLEYYEETLIKTGNGVFMQLKIHFDEGSSVKLSRQENTEYDKITAYLRKKYKQKERKT